ncbi:MAG: heavy-metal-associated domain-containing protein [Zoogloeaceae bacterium]|jgi:hypothetical protein|nr:heavy-metal-associated domain-containing protein [Zoogloeaceae bacterium]
MTTGAIQLKNIANGEEGRKIIQAFGEIPGITGVGFDLETNRVELEFVPDHLLQYYVLKTIRDTGFEHPYEQSFPD